VSNLGMKMSEIAVTQPQQTSLVARFADRFGVDKGKLLATLKATAFRQRGDRTVITDEQMMALLVVAEQYKLNPFTKEIFAFDDKGAIVPVVSVDGWARIINEHPALNGIEFRYADTSTKHPRGKDCPDWCEVIIYRKDREHPTVVREYLDEVYQPPRGKDGGYDGPWQSHTKRMLRHKTVIQGARLAFGFAGIYDEDEAHRIVQVDQPQANEKAKAATAALIAASMPTEIAGECEEVPRAETADTTGRLAA